MFDQRLFNFSSGSFWILLVGISKMDFSAIRAKRASRTFVFISVCYLILALWRTSALADDCTVVRQDDSQLSRSLELPLYTWQATGVAPKAVIVTIHGVTLHGAVFDKVASELARSGYFVVSPDLRGFGRWYLGNDKFLNDGGVSFYKSRADLIRLLAKLKATYPSLPIFCVGESLGANLALWLASVCPSYVSGVVVSSPCVKRKLDLCSPMVVDTIKATANCKHQFPTEPYVRRYLSEDPRIIESYLADPLMRKTMSVYESFQSLHAARSTLWFVDKIPGNIPVLVFEGTKDKMFFPKQIEPLLRKIPASDKNVVWLKGKGHIQLETPHASSEVIKTISAWLDEHSGQSKNQAALLSTENSSSSPREDN
jgi:alpha-beta hydrolase superfamily lysophospholipase